MRFFTAIAVGVCVALALPAQAMVNMLENGSFEDGLTGWTVDGGVGTHGSGWFWGAGPTDGDNALGAASNWGVTFGSVTQAVPVPPGPYSLTLTFDAWVFDNSNDWGFDSYVKGQIWVDGAVAAEASWSSMPTTNVQQVHVPMTVGWSGDVATSLAVKMELRGHGMGGGGWGVASVDNVQLVPEPGILAMAGLGLAGFLRRRR